MNIMDNKLIIDHNREVEKNNIHKLSFFLGKR